MFPDFATVQPTMPLNMEALIRKVFGGDKAIHEALGERPAISVVLFDA
jgi:hypothetical protein